MYFFKLFLGKRKRKTFSNGGSRLQERETVTKASFGCADKPAEKHCWLICYERKILFQLKKQAKKYGL
jgi:hypothetical protein